MKAEPAISIEQRNIKLDFNTLLKLGGTNKLVNGIRTWTFPFSSIPTLEKILGEDIVFDEDDVKSVLTKTIRAQNPNIETITLPPWKGESGYTITEINDALGNITYKIIEWWKDEDRKVHKHTSYVTEERVNIMAEILGEFDTEGVIENTPIVYQLLVKYGELKRCLNVEGVFDVAPYYGGKNRAQCYFPHFYYPLKVLVHKGEVIHHKEGGVTKLPKLEERLIGRGSKGELIPCSSERGYSEPFGISPKCLS